MIQPRVLVTNLVFCIFLSNLGGQDLSDVAYNSFYFLDSKDNIWISSSTEWNKFNSVSTTNFKNGGSAEIVGEYIQSTLHEDAKGNLWSSTYGYLTKYDPKTDHVESFQLNLDGEVVNSFYFIYKIDRISNVMWLRMGEYFVALNLTNSAEDHVSKINTHARRFIDNYRHDTLFIVGMPWVDGYGVEIISYHDGVFLNNNSYLDDTLANIKIRDGIIAGNIFWGCSNKGLITFAIENPEEYRVLIPPGIEEFYPHHLVSRDSLLYITSKNHGLWLFDSQGEEFIKNWTVDDGLKNSSPMELFFHAPMTIWLSFVGDGVQRLSTQEDHSFIFGKAAQRIFFDNDSNVQIIFDDGLVVCTDIDGKVLRSIHTKNGGLGAVQDIELKGGTMHFTDKYNYAALEIAKFLFVKTLKLSGQSNFIEKSRNQTKFVSTTSGFTLVDTSLTITNCDTLQNVMFYTKEETTYIVNKSNEILVCNQDTLINLGQYGWPVQMTEDPIHNMLVATKKGLYKIGKEIKTVIDYRLNLDDIRGFSYDGERNLWFTRAKNIYVFTADSTLVRIPSEHDIEFSNSAPIFPEDEVWFATNKGVLTVSNEIYKHYQEIPNIYVMEVFINGLKYDSPLNPDYIENMNLTWQENDLYFRTEVGEYTGDNHQSLKYRLTGLETDWNYSNKFDISYKNLQPGNYTLEMIGIGSNLRESKPKTIDIEIEAPFYQTWWFRGAVAGTLMLIGFGISYYRSQRKLEAQKVVIEKQKALQAQRHRMAQDLHDEMGSGLTTIKYISNSLKKGNDKEKIEQIERTSTGLIGSMRDLLWSLDESNDTLGNLVSKSRTTLRQICKSKDLGSKVSAEVDLNIPFPGILRRNIILIIKEAATNVIKHTKATCIEVEFGLDQEILTIKIADDGQGMAADNTSDHKSYGLNSIKSRVEQMNGKLTITSSEKGTLLSIVIPNPTL